MWNTSQCDVWMCDLMELTPPNTTAQLGHLGGGGGEEGAHSACIQTGFGKGPLWGHPSLGDAEQPRRSCRGCGVSVPLCRGTAVLGMWGEEGSHEDGGVRGRAPRRAQPRHCTRQQDVAFCPKPTAKPTGDPRPPQRPHPDPSDPHPARCPPPVSHSAGEVQAGLLQVGLEVGQQEIPPTLGADVGRAVLVHPLMGAEAAAVGHDHGARGADLGGAEESTRP